MTKHILVVDRSQTIRMTCQIHLENTGYQVLVSSSCEEALKALPKLNPVPDIALLGMQERSPELRRLVEYLQERCRGCRCILLVRQDDPKRLPAWLEGYEQLATPFLVRTLLAFVDAPATLVSEQSVQEAR
jgi:DNA-binding NtrC family response regulator